MHSKNCGSFALLSPNPPDCAYPDDPISALAAAQIVDCAPNELSKIALLMDRTCNEHFARILGSQINFALISLTDKNLRILDYAPIGHPESTTLA